MEQIGRRPLLKSLLAPAAAGIAGTLHARPARSAETKTVRFLHSETDPAQLRFFNDAIAAFEAANPDIKVAMEVYSTNARLPKLVAQRASRTVPEVIKILPEERFDWVRRGQLTAIDDVVAAIGPKEFGQDMLVPIDGHVYDLPFQVKNFSVLFYRADLMQAAGVTPPKDWDELRKTAEVLSRPIKGVSTTQYGIAFAAGTLRQTSIILSELMWSAGGTYFDKALNLTFANPATVQALELLRDLAPFAPPGIGSYGDSELRDTYVTRKAAMLWFSAEALNDALRSDKPLVAATGAAPMPRGPVTSAKYVGADCYAIAAAKVGAKNIPEAKKFLEFLLTGTRPRDLSLATNVQNLPPTVSAMQDPALVRGSQIFNGRPELTKACFDLSDSCDFVRESGAVFTGGAMHLSGVPNPYIGVIVSRNVPAMVVQKVLLEKMAPQDAASWGAEQMKTIVADLKQ